MRDGTDGHILYTLDEPKPAEAWAPTVGDVDLDGDQEIMLAGTLYDSDGSVLWSHSTPGEEWHWNVFVNADQDPQAEVVAIHDRFEVYDTDGTLLASSPDPLDLPGPPCVADFDGDGASEVAFVERDAIAVYEVDGSKSWEAAFPNPWMLATCIAWDPDADGDYEILAPLENDLVMVDGADGTLLFSAPGRDSVANLTQLVVADVDADGTAEIIETSAEDLGRASVTIWGNPYWPASGPQWGVLDYSVTNIADDGTIPASPDPYWLQEGGLYRARPAGPVYGADLVVAATDACLASCWEDGVVDVAFQVGNQGLRVYDGPVTVEARAATGALVESWTGTVALPPGAVSEPVVLELPALTGAVTLTVDPSDAVDECDDADNTASVELPTCP